MSSREALESELALFELGERMEAAREAYRADSSDENKQAYRALVDELDAARTAHITAFGPPAAKAGDAVAQPETVAADIDAGL